MSTPQKPTHFDGHYLRNRSTLDVGVLGYIGIVWPKEHSPEVSHVPPVTPCMCWSYQELHRKLWKCFDTGNLYFPPCKTQFLPLPLKKFPQQLPCILTPHVSRLLNLRKVPCKLEGLITRSTLWHGKYGMYKFAIFCPPKSTWEAVASDILWYCCKLLLVWISWLQRLKLYDQESTLMLETRSHGVRSRLDGITVLCSAGECRLWRVCRECHDVLQAPFLLLVVFWIDACYWVSLFSYIVLIFNCKWSQTNILWKGEKLVFFLPFQYFLPF